MTRRDMLASCNSINSKVSVKLTPDVQYKVSFKPPVTLNRQGTNHNM